MNTKDTSCVLDAVAHDFVPEDVNLSPQIVARVQKGNKFAMKPKTKLVAALVLILLALIVTLVSVPGAVNAMKRLFGFIPGVGIVEQGAPLRVLAEPVTQTRDGVTLTVKEAVLSADKTIVIFTLEGVQWEMLSHQEDVYGCFSTPEIRLPDGTLLMMSGGGGSPWESRFVYNPIPADVNEATFILPCISETLPGKAPENWELPLRFIPAPPELTVMPVIELSTPTHAPEANTPAPQSLLTLDKVIELEDGYILVGARHSTTLPDGTMIYAGMPSGMLRFTDANGQEIPAEYAADVDFPESSVDVSLWAFKITGKQFAWPLTITLDAAEIPLSGQELKFEFDTGPNPQTGQVWELNQDFEMDGYKARLVSIERMVDGYQFTFKADPQVTGVGAWFEGFNAVGGGGGGDGQGNMSQSVIYEGTLPAGKLTLVLSIQMVRVSGPWSVTWQPDVLPIGQPDATPAACLTKDTLAQLAPPPAEMTGKVLLYGQMDNGQDWGLTLANLDGSQKQVVAKTGSWGALSPDGSRVVYAASEGLVVVDIASGQDKALGVNGYNPRWSPDGARIAFVSADVPNVFAISVDGTNLRQVTKQATGLTYVAGWSPDGSQVYVTLPGADGFLLRSVDLATRTETDGITLKNSSRKAPYAAVSPDGAWVAYRASDNNSLYLARLDGTDWHLVMQKPGDAVSGVVWSGDLLGVSMLNSSDEGTIVLLRPDTCQAFTLPTLHGDIQGLQLP